ncbi:MAG TPA: ABC transporter ATP-binding protein [Thermomicrobiaceae bacterium]|nr:ABC transporter ATP-binding protein [Thermomicrobiaceae bacterium]
MAGQTWATRRSDTHDDAAVEFRGVSRRFRLHHEARASFQDWFVGLVRPRGKAEEFWALRDVSFVVRRGEALGIVGRNGAGKSTMLKLVTRVLEPTSGEVLIHGRTHAMLELGAGFHPELSGRDNVYLNGSIYGFSRRQMAARFDRIVQFAELERFIDTPVKHYSSGMFMRLGFAIAVHMDPEILVVDEVLAVGDTAFQRKGYEALMDLRARGTTIMFVSHSVEQIRQFCDRAILLQGGRIVDSGPAPEVVDHYLRTLREEEAEVAILRVRAIDRTGLPLDAVPSGEDLGLEVLLRVPPETSTADLALAIDLHDRAGTHLFGSTARLPAELPPFDPLDPDTRSVRSVVRGLPLAGGILTIAASLQRGTGEDPEPLDRQETRVDVVGSSAAGSRGLLRLDHDWEWGESAPAPRAADPRLERR